ncbi:MAG: hypothetical protein ACR2JQ_12020 [Mycobacteriales bacterium]
MQTAVATPRRQSRRALPGSRRPGASAVRAHWLFALLCGLGIVPRVLVQIAYRPALELYGDSFIYLQQGLTPNRMHPVGYAVLLSILSNTGHIVVVPILQHLLGIAMAVTIYALLLRLGVRRTVAALGAVPVLLDGYQIDIEHFVLGDTVQQVLLLAALTLLLWGGRPGLLAGVGVGVVLTASALVRSGALPVLVIAGVYLLVRTNWRALLGVAGAAAVCLGAYAGWMHSYTGTYGIQEGNGLFLYGRTAPIAKCDQLPTSVQDICPTDPVSARPGAEYYVYGAASPINQLPSLPDKEKRGAALARAVLVDQPGDYVRDVAGDVWHYFAPGRYSGTRDFRDDRWRFPLYKTPGGDPLFHVTVATAGFGHQTAVPHPNYRVAGWLHSYQRFVYTPGPLLLLCLLGAVLAAGPLLFRRTGRRQARWAALVFALTGLALVLSPSLAAGFSYRYGLPLLVTLPVAGAVALDITLNAVTPRRRSSVRGDDRPGRPS